MAWIKNGGNEVDEHIWARMEGAKELADLIEWSYSSGKVTGEKEVIVSTSTCVFGPFSF